MTILFKCEYTRLLGRQEYTDRSNRGLFGVLTRQVQGVNCLLAHFLNKKSSMRKRILSILEKQLKS